MREPPVIRQEPEFSDPRDREIAGRLERLIGAGAEAFFVGAIRVMESNPPFAAAAHMVAHCFRELDGALREALEPVKVRPANPVAFAPEVEERVTHRRDIEAILQGLEIQPDGRVAHAWFHAVGLQGDGPPLHALAHRREGSAPRPLDAALRARWDMYREVLEAVLDRFEARFLAVTEALDRLLAKGDPTPADAKIVATQLPRSLTAAQYFFSRLENPRWIPLLRARGLFREPPEPKKSEDEKTITFVLWPESRYLARMAPKARRDVLDVILEMRETRNTRVLEDLTDALLAMPAHMAARVADRAAAWIGYPYQFLLPRKLGALAERLARGNEVGAALKIFRELLMPQRKGDSAPETFPPYAVEARFEPFEYAHILKTHLHGIVEAAGLRTLQLLCELLDRALHIPGREADLEDRSALWRRSIEHSDSINREDIPDQLTSAVLAAAIQLIEQDPTSTPAVIKAVGAHPQRIFRRMALYLLARFPDGWTDLIGQHLADRSLFVDHWSWYEYAALLREHFGHVPLQVQQTILSWIEEGPKPGLYRRPDWEGRIPTEEEVQRNIRKWRHERLALIRNILPSSWKARYEALEQEFGAPKPIQPRGGAITSWHGPTSPFTADQLRGMSVEEITNALRTWRSTGEFDAPTPEGLGRVLADLVGTKPRRFATKANLFRGLDPTYVRNLLFGFSQAVRAERPFPWRQILALCRWAVDQVDPEGEGPKRWADRDPGWSWTRTQIARLLDGGLTKGLAEIPASYRKLVWSILERLEGDRDPSSESEAEQGRSKMDPATQSLNTVRGAAMHAVLQYALWIARRASGRRRGRALGGRGFDAIPEVRQTLETHLDPAQEQSPAVRAVYGQRLPQLVHLDQPWVAANVTRIFPREGEGAERLRKSAWGTYLVFNNPYDEVFDLIRDEYRQAVERLPSREESGDGGAEGPEERLAEHLMVLYWRGRITLEEGSGGLLRRFFDVASDALRERAISFVGRMLSEEANEPPTPEVVARLRELWDWRLGFAKNSGRTGSEELGAFGWWFASGLLGDDSALPRLLAGLRLIPKTDPDHLVLQRLAVVAGRNPLEAIECLTHMVEGDERGWIADVWRGEVRSMLRAAAEDASAKVRGAIREFVSRLAARGVHDFREFL